MMCQVPGCLRPGTPASNGTTYCRGHLLLTQGLASLGVPDEMAPELISRLSPPGAC